MAKVTSGSLITAASANQLGDTARKILGVGTGDYGYGQTPLTPVISTGDVIVATNYRDKIIDDFVLINKHQKNQTSIAGISKSNYAVGLIVDSIDTNSLETVMNTLISSRLTAHASNMSLTSSVRTSVKSGAWRGTISTEIDYKFTSANAARYFFNSGGELRVRCVQPGTAIGDRHWQNTLNRLGVIGLAARSTYQKGTVSLGSVKNMGFYTLTGTMQMIYDGTKIDNNWPASYSLKDSVYVYAMKVNDTTIRIRYELVEANNRNISTGTTVHTDIYKSVVVVRNIETPTTSIFKSF